MLNPMSSIFRQCIENKKTLNIICSPTHEAYETGLAMTGHRFFAFRAKGIKDWNVKYRPIPKNYTLLDARLGASQIPTDITGFDLVLSQNKFGQYQALSAVAKYLNLPLISLEHTLPVPQWPKEQREYLKTLRGHLNLFISKYSIKEWGFDEYDPTVKVIEHMIDTDLFKYNGQTRQNHILSVVNDWINRDWCKLAGQKILTENGYIPIEKIKIGDRVLTDSGNFETVYNTMSRNYFGDIIKLYIENMKEPVCFTPEHHIRVYRDGQEKYIEANRIRKGDILKFPKIKQTSFETKEYDYAWLIGTIIGDGSISNTGNISVVFNKNEKNRQDSYQKIASSHTKNKVYVSNRHNNVSTVEFSSKPFATWLKDKIGEYSKIKRIPDFLFNGCDIVKLGVLRGLWGCDGSFKNGNRGDRFVYSTTSVKLASQVSAILHHFGIKCFISKEKRTTNKSNGKIVPIYRVRSNNPENVEKCKNLIYEYVSLDKLEANPYNYSVSRVEVEEYNGLVYNCSVNNDPSYVCYPGFVAHNCCNFQGWQRVTNKLPVCVLGDTPGLSKPAQSTADLVNAYASSKIFLNTSTISPVPTALMEAMSSGCCVISTATCMIPEIIEHGANGLISNDERELRQFCIDMLRDDKTAEKLGQAARETIEKRFHKNRFINTWNKYLFNVIGENYEN